jgi:hypothetical protein
MCKSYSVDKYKFDAFYKEEILKEKLAKEEKVNRRKISNYLSQHGSKKKSLPKGNSRRFIDETYIKTQNLVILNARIKTQNEYNKITTINNEEKTIPVLTGKVTTGGAVVWIGNAYSRYDVVGTESVTGYNEVGIKKTKTIVADVLISFGTTESNAIVEKVQVDNYVLGPSSFVQLTNEIPNMYTNPNSARLFPGYKDHVLVLIRRYPIKYGFSGIKGTVVCDVPQSSREYTVENAQLNNPSDVQRISTHKICFFENDEFVIKLSVPPFTETLRENVGPQQEKWFYHNMELLRVNGDTLTRLSLVTNQASSIQLPTTYKEVVFHPLSGEVYWLDNNTLYSTREAHTPLPFPDIVEAANVVHVSVNAVYIDFFFDNGKIVRFFPAQGYLPPALYNVQTLNAQTVVFRTGKYYLLFNGTTCTVYKKTDFSVNETYTNIGNVVPFASGAKQWSDTCSFITDTSIITLDLIHKEKHIHELPQFLITNPPKEQFPHRGIILGITNTGKQFGFRVKEGKIPSTDLSLYQIANKIGSPLTLYMEGLADVNVSGYVFTGNNHFDTEINALFKTPYPSDTGGVAVDRLTYSSVTKTAQGESVQSCFLKFNDVTTMTNESVVGYGLGTKTEMTTSFHCTPDQAYLLAANFVANNIDNTVLKISTNDTRFELGDTIIYHNEEYIINKVRWNNFIEYEAHKKPRKITVVPSEYLYKSDVEGDDKLEEALDEKLEIRQIPVQLDPVNNVTLCIIKEEARQPIEGLIGTPNLFPVSIVSISSYGEAISFPPATGIFFDEESFYVSLNAQPTNVTSATYEELLNDQYKNLFFIGYEAVQAQEITHVGGKTYKLTGLLRGRFGTDFFINYHRVGEPAYVYAPDEVGTFQYIETHAEGEAPPPIRVAIQDKYTIFDPMFTRTTGTVNVTQAELSNMTFTLTVDIEEYPAELYITTAPYVPDKRMPYILKADIEEHTTEFALPDTVRQYNQLWFYVFASGKWPMTGIINYDPTGGATIGSVREFGAYGVFGERRTERSGTVCSYAVLKG